ncbi:MAG TPA: uroporphyrinogen decarboxylase family protein [bacterium]|uniref:Methylcobalamin:coenzyme M methyltransferase n=1 Tax=candidate division TA06 bacterium ADurb.Bin417 TaxID=1852828 RepID=A0A1V5MIL4_UNCT6|nr:MAG: methylcobalamin:coenzyme M methyltransferase [candidate division TA06 bacterium ADurb.Bin417]HNS48480.1 uroporphyrinogen decarboxylase family protein [bacterium]
MKKQLTSRQRVMTAFEHREPDRIPAWCGSSPGFWEKARRGLHLDDEGIRQRFGDDFRRIFESYSTPPIPLSPAADSRSLFGVERRGIGYGQPLSHPLAEASRSDLARYPWPDPDWLDTSRLHSQAAPYRETFAILGGAWSPFWHDLIDLLGLETLCLKMYEDPGFVDAVLDRITGFYLEVNRRIFEAAADRLDIFFIGNDFGSQTGPLISPNLFRRFLLPRLEKFCVLGHRYGLKVMLHCCGGIYPLMPLLAESGLDAVHAIQTSCRGMELPRLKSEFGNRILFNGCIDSHQVLIKGTPESIREDVRRVLEIMKPGGGFVAGASHDTILEETPLENTLAMFDAIREFGAYG